MRRILDKIKAWWHERFSQSRAEAAIMSWMEEIEIEREGGNTAPRMPPPAPLAFKPPERHTPPPPPLDLFATPIPRHEELVSVIGNNIAALERLKNALARSLLISEEQKVNDMLAHSESCLEMMRSLRSKQLFYKETLSCIRTHTKTVSDFVKTFRMLDLDEVLMN